MGMDMFSVNTGSVEIVAARDPLGRALVPSLVEELAPLGVGLRLETNSRHILEAARDAFGRYGTEASDKEAPRFALRLLAEPSFRETAPWPEPVYRGQGSLFYVCVGRQNTAVADLRQRQATGFVAAAMAEDIRFLQRTFLECLVLTMLTHGPGATHTYVHASAVVKDGRGLLLSGPRESGKSTLAYACAKRGFRILTDDVVYLREESNGLSAWGRPWQMRFLPDCTNHFPELSRACEDNGVIQIDLEEFLPDRVQTCCEPSAVFFLDRTSSHPECEELPPEEAARLLARDLIYDSPEVMERHCRTWLHLARRGSYVLRYGNDWDSAIRLLERFV
jgi:hypothetical protein